MKTIILPDGRRFSIENVDYHAIETTVIFTLLDTSTKIYQCTSATAAAQMITDLNTFVANTALFITTLSDAGVVTWSSVTPNAYTLGNTAQDYIIAGTLFLGSNVNAFKGDNGTPGQEGYFTPLILSDTQIDMANGNVSFDFAGIYTLYYSTDNGTSWTTTGLTVTVT